jgi:hypothetical protein
MAGLHFPAINLIKKPTMRFTLWTFPHALQKLHHSIPVFYFMHLYMAFNTKACITLLHHVMQSSHDRIQTKQSKQSILTT